MIWQLLQCAFEILILLFSWLMFQISYHKRQKFTKTQFFPYGCVLRIDFRPFSAAKWRPEIWQEMSRTTFKNLKAFEECRVFTYVYKSVVIWRAFFPSIHELTDLENGRERARKFCTASTRSEAKEAFT